MEYRALQEREIDESLFNQFIRRQVVTKCLRKNGQGWVAVDAPFIDDWTKDDFHTLVGCLKRTVCTGGVVYAAKEGAILKGFASVEPKRFGPALEYLDLSSLHVSEDRRGRGLGTRLFQYCCKWAKNHGAQKLYISSHSAVETQAFYQAMGCVDAQQYNQSHVELEPYDRQLEYVL